MPIVKMPDGTQVRFPDEMPQEEIKGFISQKFPDISASKETTVKQPRESLANTVFQQGMQGATFGFADEPMDVIGAAIASAADKDLSFGDAYKQARELTKESLSRQMQQRPVTSILSNIAGGMLTGGAAASTKLGASLLNNLRSGSLGARAVKGAISGSATGGVYGAGTGEDGNRIESAKRGAAIGGILGAAMPVAGAAISKLNTRVNVPTSEQVRDFGSKAYKIAEQKGGALSSDIADNFYDQVLKIKPQTEAGQVFKGQSPVTAILDAIPSLKGKPLTLEAAQEVDSALGDLAYSTMDKFGKLNSDGKKFLDMQTALRRTIENADENMIIGGKEGFNALKEARKYWSTSLKMRDIERIIENAQRMEQPATGIRTGFRTLLRNADRLKGYSPKEIEAIKNAADTGVVTDLFRLAGSGLVPIGSGIAGTAAGGPVGGLVSAAVGSGIQQASKAIGKARQMGRAEEALKKVAERSGLVTEEQILKLPPDIVSKISKMPPKAARALLEKLKQTSGVK